VQEEQKVESHAATKSSAGHWYREVAILSAAPWPAVPLRLATLAFVERQAKEHPRGTERLDEGLIVKGRQIISHNM